MPLGVKLKTHLTNKTKKATPKYKYIIQFCPNVYSNIKLFERLPGADSVVWLRFSLNIKTNVVLLASAASCSEM